MSVLHKCFWGYGYAWNWVSHYDDNATISHKNESRSSLRATFLREVMREWQAKQDTVARSGKDGKSSSFPLSLMALLLTHVFVCHLKWRGCSQAITFLGNCARSVFSESVYFRISKEKFVHISLFTHFKQHLTITCGTHTCLTQKVLTYVWYNSAPSVRSNSILFSFVGVVQHCLIINMKGNNNN